MSGINPISFKQMRPEKQRKVVFLNRKSHYDKMQNQKVGEYYIKFIRPKKKGSEDN